MVYVQWLKKYYTSPSNTAETRIFKWSEYKHRRPIFGPKVNQYNE
jgi:hypothetical protein